MKLSVIMMVKNGASTVERAIRSLGSAASELIVHDTGSTDGTLDLILEVCRLVSLEVLPLRSDSITHSTQFFTDFPESFDTDVPTWTWTGKPLLRDWSWGLNGAADLCQHPYIMRLDADDVFQNPENIPATLMMLEQKKEIEVISCPYNIKDPYTKETVRKEMQDRIWRRGSVSYQGVIHEKLLPRKSGALLYAGSGLSVTDMRDSTGGGTRVHGRNAKTLLYEYERVTKKIDEPDFLYTLAHEMIPFDPAFAIELLQKIGDKWPMASQGGGDVLFQLGRANEELSNWQGALSHYDASVEIELTPDALLHRGFLKKQIGLPSWRSDFEVAETTSKLRGMFNTDLVLLAEAKNLLGG